MAQEGGPQEVEGALVAAMEEVMEEIRAARDLTNQPLRLALAERWFALPSPKAQMVTLPNAAKNRSPP